MNKYFHNFLVGVSVLPVFAVVPAFALEMDLYGEQTVDAGLYENAARRYIWVNKDAHVTVNGGAVFRNNQVLANGGGTIFNQEHLTINGDQEHKVVFENNHAGWYAGGIINYSKTEITNALFDGNFTTGDAGSGDELTQQFVSDGQTYMSMGGAIFSTGESTITDSVFSNNKSGNAGAIYNSGEDMSIYDGEFSGNESIRYGGAIMNGGSDAELFINGTKFIGNYTTGEAGEGDELTQKFDVGGKKYAATGGAIYNSGKATIIGAEFTGNKSGDAGAIYNSGFVGIVDSVFTSNDATSGGGAILQPFDVENKINVFSSKFIGNTGSYAGGIGAYNILNVTDSEFNNNKALKADENGGGAVMLGGHGKANISTTSFVGNTANAGGAIATRPRGANAMGDDDASEANKDGHWMIISKSEFSNNISGVDADGNDISGVIVVYGRNSMISGDGGAIWNGFEGTTVDGVVHKNVISESSFENNVAKRNGGAIYNEGNITIFDTTFVGNNAAGVGGAIYNYADGNIILSGKNSFNGNIANGVSNDIYNTGALIIEDGVTTISGGIDGNGALTISNGAKLNIGTSSIVQDSITLNGDMVATLRDAENAQITTKTFNGDGKLTLVMSDAGTYNVFGNAKFANTDFDDSGITVSSPVYNVVWDGGRVTSSRKSIDEIAQDNSLSTESAAAISNLMDSSSNQLNALAFRMQERLAEATDYASQAFVAKEIEHATKAIHPETESVTQSVATSVQSAVTNLASARMAGPVVGRNGGDVKLTSGGVWAQGIFNRSKHNDSFSGDTRGIAVGLDGTFNKHWMIGVGYSFASSDISGSARDTDIDSNTLFVYGQYKPSEWYLNAVANYTWSDYSEYSEDTLVKVFSDYSVDSFGGTIAAGYDFASGVTPELALRYMHVSSDDYTNSVGVKTEIKDTDFLTGSFGAKYAFNVQADKYTMFIPQLNAAVKYDMLSDKGVSTVTMPNINAYTLSGERLSRISGEFGFGIGVRHRNVDVSINYDIDVRKDYTSQTGMLKLRCNF